jgi:predicted methyltransferase MtxX (methanogen marker protein 4)
MVFGRRKADVEALSQTVQTLSGQVTGMDERLMDCHRQHEECEAKRQKDREELDDLKAKQAADRALIERLMRGEIATYTEISRTPRRAGS